MNDVFLIQPALVIATRQFRRKKEKKKSSRKRHRIAQTIIEVELGFSVLFYSMCV